ncbi:MAG: translation initiation factor [Bacteroidales bacterium]|nr:translation initiation factor [Bacteroidales bacterium]
MVNKRISRHDDVTYSTHPEFEFEYENIREPDTLPPEEQDLTISLSKRKMDGCLVTSVTGFSGKRVDLLDLEQELKNVCRSEGTTRMYDVVLFRDVRKRAYVYLRNQGYKVRFKDS